MVPMSTVRPRMPLRVFSSQVRQCRHVVEEVRRQFGEEVFAEVPIEKHVHNDEPWRVWGLTTVEEMQCHVRGRVKTSQSRAFA